MERPRFFNTCRSVFLIALTVAVLHVARVVAGESPSTKPAVPDQDSLKKAMSVVRDVFKESIAAARKPDEKVDLSKKLLRAGFDEKKDLAARYSLLEVARDAAIEGGDFVQASKVIDEMESSFEIDALKSKAEAAIVWNKTPHPVADRKAFVGESFSVVETSIKADRYEVARQVGDLMLLQARAAGDASLTRQATSENQLKREAEAAHAEVKSALAALQDNPKDPDANLKAGRYRCFFKGEWKVGLAMLALGSDRDLKALAEKDIAGLSGSEGQVALADAWWNMSEKTSGIPQRELKRHAGVWYGKAAPGLEGLLKARVDKRLLEAGRESSSEPVASTSTEPENANPEYRTQGEYEGTAGADKIGVQVVANGEGQFDVSFLAGGLPGAGWDQKNRTTSKAVSADGKTAVSGGGITATIAGGKITGKTGKGADILARKIVRESPTLGAKPARGAIILFDGTNADAFEDGHLDERHFLASGTQTKQRFGDFTCHLEFQIPFLPTAHGQARANSGVYLQERYELQILDSFGLVGDNHDCGSLYGKTAPLVNMCFPPMTWQTYDIDFQAAKFEAGKKFKNAVVTVRHNGVLIHDKAELSAPTGGGKPESPQGGPLQLQMHINAVFFRNIWLVEKE